MLRHARRRASVLSLTASALLFAGCAHAPGPDDAAGPAPSPESRPFGAWSRALGPDVAAAAPRLSRILRDGLVREKPFQVSWPSKSKDGRPLSTAFRGSYDRHSNMAAHWAALTIARLEGDAGAIAEIVARFDGPTLENERFFVASTHARSAMRPYDQTWLALFLAELERHVVADDARAAIRAFRDECAARLLDYVEEQDFPPTASAGEPEAPASRLGGSTRPASRPESRAASRPRAPRAGWTSGAYPSAVWALAVLELAPPPDPAARARVEALRRARLPVVAAHLRAEPPENRFRGGHGYDFFHAPTLATLAERLAGANDPAFAGPRVAYPPTAAEKLPAKITLPNCHRLGFELSKTWCAAFDAGTGDEAARAAVAARLADYLRRTDAWDGDFLTVSHWIPQFVFFPLWLAAGRP